MPRKTFVIMRGNQPVEVWSVEEEVKSRVDALRKGAQDMEFWYTPVVSDPAIHTPWVVIFDTADLTWEAKLLEVKEGETITENTGNFERGAGHAWIWRGIFAKDKYNAIKQARDHAAYWFLI